MDFKKTIIEVRNITKAATFKSFLHLSYKNTQLLYFVTVLFNIFMRQTLTDDIWELHKNMKCALPLSRLFNDCIKLLPSKSPTLLGLKIISIS